VAGRISSGGLRTLVISDLHLGNRVHRAVLGYPEPLRLLLEALDDVDRLVLLGDLVELVTRNPRRSLAAAEPVLRTLGRRMGADREVIVVPGNHDFPLVRAWAQARGAELSIDDAVEPHATGALARMVSWLGPSTVRVRYPGVWLGEGIYATHGHYLDHHLIPEGPVGLPRGRLRGPASPVRPSEYERGRIRSHHRRDTFVSRALQRPLRTAIHYLPRLLMNARLAPVSAALVDVQMRRAAMPALDRVLRRLEIEADWVVFGHVHRRGPLADDRPEYWRAQNGARFVNTGSWLDEPLLMDRAIPPHPYWPGGAVIIEPGAEPRAVGLLDGLPSDAFRSAG
jgi:UDP-2,3-diacylglucosamine pyrophosphatase LpxH